MLLLVEDRRGYQNLCRLLTAAKSGKPKGEGAAEPRPMLAEHAGGLIALAGRDAAPRSAGAARPVRARAASTLELQRHLDDDQAHRNRGALAQAEALGVGVVATNDVRYAHAARCAACTTCSPARALKTTVDAVGRRCCATPSAT